MTNGTGGDGRDDIDVRFAEIVSRWNDAPTPRDEAADRADDALASAESERLLHRPAGTEEGAPADRGADDRGLGTDPESLDAFADGPYPHGHTASDAVPWRVHVPPEDEDEPFEPAPVAPLPPFLADWTFYLALGCLVGGPLALVYFVIFVPEERSSMVLAGLAVVVGFVTLVMRQPGDRDPDDTDDGARV